MVQKISRCYFTSRYRDFIISIKLLITLSFFVQINATAASADSVQQQTAAHTYTTLSGALPPQLTAAQSPYLAEADIFVSPGTTVTIERGVAILFSNFTGMHVQGTLYVKGSKEQPVIFTSKNDQFYNQGTSINAAPYDWNGIDVYESALGTSFDNCIVQFSVYGVRSQTEHLKIINSFFLQNGKSDVSVKENTFTAGTTAFSYNLPIAEVSSTPSAVALKDTLNVTPESPSKAGKNHNGFRSFLRYTGLVLAVGSLAAGAFEYQQFTKAQDEFNAINETNDNNLQTYTSEDWDNAHKNYTDKTTGLGICGGACGLGLLLFVVSFTF